MREQTGRGGHPVTAYYLVKVVVTVALVVLVSELAKRSSLAGAVLASVPLVSVLAMLWLYAETHDPAKVSALAADVFWLVLPSLVLFIALPLLLRKGLGFYLSLTLSVALTAGAYALMIEGLRRFGLRA